MYKELAGSVISNELGEVLLIHRNTPKLTQWELPGGKVEEGETLEETALRETLEEIDVKVEIIKKIGSACLDDSGRKWRYHWFEAQVHEGSPKIIEEDRYDGIGYFNLQAPGLNTSELSVNVRNLNNYLKNK
jgi:ADP-ribose pyrophosphatase YjhB (NUDIX family)